MTGRKTKIENGQPRITPTTATETAIAGFSRRNRPEERLTAYIENELGKKPANKLKTLNIREIQEVPELFLNE